MPARQAAELLPALARRTLASQAVMLSAPEWPRVPDCLRRADSESLYVALDSANPAVGLPIRSEAAPGAKALTRMTFIA